MERTLPLSLHCCHGPRHAVRAMRLLAAMALLLTPFLASAQEVVDSFNRANSNTVGGGWSETETGAAGASINGNGLRLQRTSASNGRQFVSRSTPGTYSTTLSENNCQLTWAFNMRQTRTNPNGFAAGGNGVAVVLAGSNADLNEGQGYAVVLGTPSTSTDPIRLVRYNGGLDADGNLTNIISAGDFANEYLDIRVTYAPATNTWQLFYRDNGTSNGWFNPLTAGTSAGTAVNSTYTGTALPFVGLYWNHDGSSGEYAHFDNFHVPSGRPAAPTVTPASATICAGSDIALTASSSSASTTRATFSSSGGPATVSASGANDASIYPWNVSVSGLPTSGVSVESVTINGINHTYPDDYDILLQSPTGTNVILMSDAGGSANITGVNLHLMDGEQALPDNAAITSGIYAPTNHGTPDNWPNSPGPGSFSQSSPSLSLFTGNPNGTWRLLIRDDANLDAGQVASWSITFIYSSTLSYTWTPATGLSATTGATVTAAPTSTTTYTVTAGHSANGCTRQGTVTVTVTSSSCTFYSRASGEVTDAIWSDTPSGTPGPASFSAGIAMVVQSGHTITLPDDATVNVKNVTVDAGGTLVLGDNANLVVNGTSLTVNGTLTADDKSEVEILGAGAKTLTLASPTTFGDLTINATAGTTATGGINIRGTLLLQNGAFDASGAQVTLVSDAGVTGRLGPVAATASYTGNLKIERYIPAGATNWRLLGSPITSKQVVHLQDDFTTAGYPGSHHPSFDQPVGSGILWPSIRWYDETNTGSSVNDGLVGVSSHLQALTPGQGFAAWCGTGLTTTAAFTIDLGAQPPVVASSPVTLPMTWTNTGNPSVDGWNLVANPLPSPIAFDQISRGADVEDYITYYDPATGNMATWDISLGAGTNGGTNTIQSMQGFYLKATGPAVTTTVAEAAKVAGNSGGFFGGLEQVPNLLRLRIASGINSFSDETVVVFANGEPAFTSNDVPKLNFGHPQAPRIGTLAEAVVTAINAYGPYSAGIQIPVLVDVAVTGTYTLTALGLDQLGLSCLRLEDLVTGELTPLAPGTAISFAADADADPLVPRFMLHASTPIDPVATDALCHGTATGAVQLELPAGSAGVTVYNAMGDAIALFEAASGAISLPGLAMGDYEVVVEGYLGCPILNGGFRVEQPAPVQAEATVADATCPGTPDGQISLSIVGGMGPYAAQWADGLVALERPAAAGVHVAYIADANGCASEIEVTVGSGHAPIAAASASATSALVGQAISFINASADATGYLWDFGDGATSTEESPEHAYAAPGAYTVTLTADNGSCSSSTTLTVTVELGTALVDGPAAPALRAWLNGAHLVVEHGFEQQGPVLLEILSEAGQLWQQRRVAGQPGRLSVPADDLASGIWYVRVTSGEQSRTLPVVVAR